MYKKTVLFLFVFILSFGFPFVSAHALADIPTANILAVYDFESSGADSTGNNYDMSSHGSPSYVSSVLGNGVDLESSVPDWFNGSDGDTWSAFEFSGSFSIAFWFKPESLSGANRFVSMDDADDCDGGYSIFYNTQIRWGYQLSGCKSWNTGQTLSTGNQYHLTFVYDDVENLRLLYVNGVHVANFSTSGSPDWDTDADYFDFGNINTYPTQAADGIYDQLIVMDYRLDDDQISELYNGGSGVAYPFVGASYEVSIDNLYFSPNVTIYTDSSITGTVSINDTTESPQANFYLKVDNVTVENKTTTSFSGSTATSSAFSSANFKQGDWLSMCATITNSSNFSQVYASEQCTSEVQVQNRLPSAVLSWSTTSPFNDTNFSGIVTPSDSDADYINITYDIYKNNVYQSSGSSNNHASPYGDITLFTILDTTTQVGDNYTFNVSIFDGYDSYASGDSAYAVVQDEPSNFTTVLNDEWSDVPINNYTLFVESNETTNLEYTYRLSTSPDTFFEYYFVDKNTAVYVNNTLLDESYIGDDGKVTASVLSGIGRYSFTIGGVTYTTTPNVSVENRTVYYAINDNTLITGEELNGTGNLTFVTENYFPRSYNNVNFNESFQAYAYQSQYRFNTYEYLSESLLTDVNYTINSIQADTFNLSAGQYTVTATKNGYYPLTLTFTAEALANQTLNITGMSTTVINISVYDGITGERVDNYTGYAYNINEDYNVSFSGLNNFTLVGAIQDEYVVYVESQGYVINASNSFVYNASSGVNYINFTLYPGATANLNFYNELTGASMSGTTVNFTLVGSSGGSFSTSNGTYQLSSLNSDSYTLAYTANGFTTRYYPFTIDSNTFYNISLYLLENTSTYTTVTISIIDDQYAEIADAVVKALKYNPSSNAYEQVTSGRTGPDGTLDLQLFLNSEFYKFVVEYNGQTVRTTTPDIITSTSLVIPIVISNDLFNDFFEWNSYDYSLSFNPVSNNWRFDYNDVTNTISTQSCLRIYRMTSSGELTQINSSCSTSSSSTLIAGITPVNGTTYVARAYFDQELIIQDVVEFTGTPNIGNLGWLLQIIITLVFAVAASFSVELLPISVGSSFIVGKALGISVLSWEVIAGLFVAMLVISFIINRNKV